MAEKRSLWAWVEEVPLKEGYHGLYPNTMAMKWVALEWTLLFGGGGLYVST